MLVSRMPLLQYPEIRREGLNPNQCQHCLWKALTTIKAELWQAPGSDLSLGLKGEGSWSLHLVSGK